MSKLPVGVKWGIELRYGGRVPIPAQFGLVFREGTLFMRRRLDGHFMGVVRI